MPSKLEQLQLQFRQRLNEERLIKIHNDNQQKALSKVSRYTNGYQITTHSTIVAPKPPPVSAVTNYPHQSPIKKGSPGVDRSRPLPPIFKEQKNLSSSRSSPISSPIENAAKTVSTVDSRSKSADLELKNKPAACAQTAKVPLQKNGIAKPISFEPKQTCQTNGASDKKPAQDMLAKLKQAELQRLKANSKPRDEPTLKNGYTSTMVKATSPVAKKPIKTTAPSPAPSRPKPKIQASIPPTRRANPPASKPGIAQTSNNKKSEVARKPPGPGQEQCGVCGRNFNQDRIEKHVPICKKASQKKVKVFDATKMRVKGTEAAQFVKKGLPKSEPKPKKSNWRKQHSEFIEAIRQAKIVQQHLAKGGKVSDLPPPPPSDTSDYVPCPHCGRKFNQGVADRHIPKCKNILSNKKTSNGPPRRK